MDKETALAKLKEILHDQYFCTCDYDYKCKSCDSHKDMVECAVALQYAIDFIESKGDNNGI